MKKEKRIIIKNTIGWLWKLAGVCDQENPDIADKAQDLANELETAINRKEK